MKKAISLLLSLAMLVGVGSMLSVSAADTSIKVGFGRADFTPAESVNMTGIDARKSTGTLTPEDRLMTTVVAFADADGNTALVCTMDLLKAYIADATRKAISDATGVPVANIHISATHTHSAPDADDPAVRDLYMESYTKAAKEAIADLTAATAKYASVKVSDMTRTRMYWRSGGTINGHNFATSGGGTWLKPSIYDVDDELQVLRLVRDGKKDVVMVNYQTHATTASCTTDYGYANRPYMSADFITYLRNHIEAQDTDALVAYYSGASGNAHPAHLRTEHRDLEKCPEDTTLYGKLLGSHVLDAMKNMKSIDLSGSIKSMEMAHKTVDKSITAVTTAPLGVITIGKSLAFASAGYEMFHEHGKYVKDNSPFDVTLVLSNSNGDRKYVPSLFIMQLPELLDGNPNAYEAASCLFIPGAGEDFSASLVAMLNALYK